MWGEEKYHVLPKQIVHFSFCFFILYFLSFFSVCIELNFRIIKLWWLPLVGDIVGVPRTPIVAITVMSGEREGG